MIIHVVLNVIVIQLVHLNQYVIHTQVLVYAKKMCMVHDVIDVLMVHLLCYRTIPRAVPIVTALARPHNVIQVYSIIDSFGICLIGH